MQKRGRTIPIARAMRARRNEDEVRRRVLEEIAELEQAREDHYLGEDVEHAVRSQELPVARELAMRRLITHFARKGTRAKLVA